MVLARSYGTSTWDPIGFLAVIVAPPVTLLAGIGLLRRKAWARTYIMALLAVIIVPNLYAMIRPPRAERRYTSPSGVPTTVLASPRTIFRLLHGDRRRKHGDASDAAVPPGAVGVLA